MARLYTYAEYYGAVFPPENLVGPVAYGPTGDEYFGTATITAPPAAGTDFRGLYANSWQKVPNVHNAGFEFGPQRKFAGTAPTAPAAGVKVRKANPTQKQMIDASATNIGIDGTDQIITVWAYSLSSTYAFEPKPKDKVLLLDEDNEVVERWIIESVKRAVFGAQFVCYCKASPLNSSELAVV